MDGKNWEPGEKLDRYIYDYLMKRNLHESAKVFIEESKVSTEPVEIDAPGGFLYEWWCIVWDMHAARYNQRRSESVAAYLEAKERKAREHQQQIQMQQMQMMQQRNFQLQCRDPFNPSLGGPLGAMNFNGMHGQPSATASVVARKLHEKSMKIPQYMDSKAPISNLDANRMATLKSAVNLQSQLLHGNTMGMSADLRKMDCRSQLNREANIRPEGNLNEPRRSDLVDPSFVYGQAFMQSNSGSIVAGLNQGIANMPLNGWPLTEADRPRPNLTPQLVGHNHLHNQTQISAQSQVHISLQNSSTYVGTAQNAGSCPRRGLSVKNDLSIINDASTLSPTQTSPPKMNVKQEHNGSSQQKDHTQQHKLLNNNKRRHPSSSRLATSIDYGNTTTHAPNSPSLTHIPNTGTTKAPDNPQPANSPGTGIMYHQDGSTGLLSSYDQLEDINTLTNMDFLDDSAESYQYLITEQGEGKDGHSTHLITAHLPSPNI